MQCRLSLCIHPHLHILGARSFSRRKVLLRLATLTPVSHSTLKFTPAARMSVLIVDDINYWRCTILRRLWPELIPCQGECEILIFTPIQSQPSPLSALSHTQDTGAGKLQCANKLGTQRKLRMSCDLMTTELFSHAGDTWVIVMIVIVMVMIVTRFSFPHKSRKLLVILSCFSLVTPVCPGRREWGG